MKKRKRNVAVNGLMMFALFFSTVAANTFNNRLMDYFVEKDVL